MVSANPTPEPDDEVAQTRMPFTEHLAELRLLDASARYFGPPVERQPIPTLQEVLDLARGRAAVHVEIKLRSDGSRYPGIESRVVEALRRNGFLDQAAVLSFDFPTLQSAQQLEPRLKTWALISKSYMQRIGPRGPAAVAAEMSALGVHGVGVEKTWLSEALYGALRAAGLGVSVWTVNEPQEMRRFALLGVDSITSDRPDLLLEAILPPASR